MRFLLDTHTFIWFVYNSKELPQHTRDVIEEEQSELFLSMASVWEMAIKVSIGKLQLSDKVTNLVTAQTITDDITLLPVELSHLDVVEHLPLHHKDPFDRLLIAQAQAERLPIISIDTAFDIYGVNRLWLT